MMPQKIEEKNHRREKRLRIFKKRFPWNLLEKSFGELRVKGFGKEKNFL